LVLFLVDSGRYPSIFDCHAGYSRNHRASWLYNHPSVDLASTSSAGFRTASLDLALSDVDGSVPRLNLRRGVLEVGLDFIGSKRSPSLGREPHGNPLARRLDVNALDLLGL
jgi:hypothetical protein